MTKVPVIIDCDPGTDDALMLLTAFACKKIKVLAVTTVCGNQGVEKTSLNARKILSFIGQDKIPVAAGAVKPLLREPRNATAFHGASGLGGVILPDPTFELENCNAVELIHKILKSHNQVTLVCTGPLTNIALLFTAHPEVKQNIEKIILMGGGIDHGNCSATAEFNMIADPEAAELVFNSGVPIVMCGLDITEKVLITKEHIKEFAAIPGKIAAFAVDILNFLDGIHTKMGHKGIPMHDPTTIGYLAHPELYKTVPMEVHVETQGKFTTGMTVVDKRGEFPPPKDSIEDKIKTLVCTEINSQKFLKFMKDCIASYEA